jgi:hypothetical protein
MIYAVGNFELCYSPAFLEAMFTHGAPTNSGQRLGGYYGPLYRDRKGGVLLGCTFERCGGVVGLIGEEGLHIRCRSSMHANDPGRNVSMAAASDMRAWRVRDRTKSLEANHDLNVIQVIGC